MHVRSGLLGKVFVVFLSLATLVLLFCSNDWLQRLKCATSLSSEHQKRRYDSLFLFSVNNNNKNDTRKAQSQASRTSGLRNETTIAFDNNSNVLSGDQNNVTLTSNSMIASIPKANTSPSNNFGINDTLDNNFMLTMYQPMVDEIKLHSLSEQSNVTYYLAQNDMLPKEIHDGSNNDTATAATSNKKATIQPFSSLIADPPFDNKNEDENNNYSQPPLCTREEIRLGEWVPLAMPEVPYIPTNIVCLPAEAYKSRPWNTWEWQPFAAKANNSKKCVLSKWNATTFCSLVQYATVAIVGDSLSWEQYASLTQLLGQPVTERLQVQSYLEGTFVSHLVCQKQTRLVYLRDDVLERVDLVLNASSPNILILNRGAHFKNDSILESELKSFVIPHVQAWQASCQNSQHSCRLFIRTTVPGHPSCESFKEPVRPVREMELRIMNKSFYRPRQQNYHWEDYQRQNHLSLSVYQEANLTFDVLDGYDINILRPDDHTKPIRSIDCLHSCFPGKMDTYNQLLLHFLQMNGGIAVNASSMDSWKFLNQSNALL